MYISLHASAYDIADIVEQAMESMIPAFMAAMAASINPYIGIALAVAGALTFVQTQFQTVLYPIFFTTIYLSMVYVISYDILGVEFTEGLRMAFTKPFKWTEEVLNELTA